MVQMTGRDRADAAEIAVVDLDAAPVGPPMRVWGRRHTLWVLGTGCVLVALLAVGFAWPRSVTPEVPGLRDQPKLAWTASAGEGRELAGLIVCGANGEGLGVADQREDGLRIECRRKTDGAPIWERDYPSMSSTVSAGGGEFAVVASPETAELISRTDGRVVRTIDLPDDNGEDARVVLTSSGEPLISIGRNGQTTVSKLAGQGDGFEWATDIGHEWLGPALAAGWATLTEHEGHLWDGSFPGHYAVALNAGDGAQPEWSANSGQLSFVGRVVVAASLDGSEMSGHDIRTGRKLWSREGGSRQDFVGGGDGLYAVDFPGAEPAEATTVSRVDPHSGRVQWSTPLDHGAGLLRVIGDALIVIDTDDEVEPGQASTVTMLRVGTGEIGWSSRLGGSGVHDVVTGQDQVFVQTYHLQTAGDGVEQVDDSITALDLRTGEARWEAGSMWLDRQLGVMVGFTEDGKIDIYR